MKVLPVFITDDLSKDIKREYNNLTQDEKDRLNSFIKLSQISPDISEIHRSINYHTLVNKKGLSSIYLNNKNKRAIFKKEKINDKNYLVLFNIITDHKEYKRINKKSNEDDDTFLDFHF